MNASPSPADPKVSVIIPLYNVERLVGRCLDSVLGQTLRELEVVCVDDGSPDGSAAVVEDYARRDARVRLLRQENQGPGAARNLGISRARGVWVTFVDGDDAIGHPRYLQRLVEAAECHDVALACAGIVKIKPGRQETRLSFSGESLFLLPEERLRAVHCPPDYYVWNKIYRRSLLLEKHILFPPGRLGEDALFSLRCMVECGPMVTVPEVWYAYTLNPHSLTKSSDTRRKQRERYEALRACMDYLEKNNVAVPKRYRSIPVRSYGFLGLTFLKWRERYGKRTLLLFDLLPLWRHKAP